jgi:hypothetical protein
MTAELDPLDAVIERIRRSEPPADGWPRARKRAASRRLRRPAFALAAAAVMVGLSWLAVPPAPFAGRGEAPPAADVAHAPNERARAADPMPMADPKTDSLPPAAGGSMAGVWRTPRLAVASNAPVFVSTGGTAPIRMGDTVPAGTVGERVHVWNWEKSPESRVLPAGVVVKGAFALTPDGTTLLTTDGRTVDLATGKADPLPWWGDGPPGLKLRPHWLTFSPDGRTLLAFEHDEKVGTARLIDYPAGTERTRVCGLWWAASKAAFSADGKTVVLYGSDAHLRSFDAATGKEKVRFAPGFENTIQAIAVSADGARVAGSYREAVRVWDAATGKLVCEPNAKGGPMPWFGALAFSPDGKRLAGGGTEPLVLWNAADGTLVHRYPRESFVAGHVRFDAAGTTITTVKDFHIWSRPEGGEVTVYPTVDRWRADAPARAEPKK